MHSDSWGDPDDGSEGSVLDSFSYAPAPRHHDDDPDDWGGGFDTAEVDPPSAHYLDEVPPAVADDRRDQPPADPAAETEEATTPFVFAVSVSNPAGTISATATISGWLQRVELTPAVTSMTEYDLARDIVATAELASLKGRASQHTLVQDMLTYQGLDRHSARDYLDQYMDLPTPDQAEQAEAQARARYLRGEY